MAEKIERSNPQGYSMSPKSIVEIVEERKVNNEEGEGCGCHKHSPAIGMIPYSLLCDEEYVCYSINVKRFKILTIIVRKWLNLTINFGFLKEK